MPNAFTDLFPDTPHRNINATAVGTVVKASKGFVFAINVYNVASAVAYLKFYDKATAPTASDVPVLVIGIPPTNTAPMEVIDGITFNNGISYRACTGVTDADNTAPATNNVNVNLTYQ